MSTLQTSRAPSLPMHDSTLPTVLCVLVAMVGALLTGIDARTGVAYAASFACFVILFIRMELMLYGIVAFIVTFIDGWAPTRSPEDVVFRLGIGRLYIMEIAVYALLVAYAIRRFLEPRNRHRSFFAPTPLDRPLWVFAALLPAYGLYGLARGNPLQDSMGYFEWRSLFLAIVFYFLVVSLLDTRTKAVRFFWWFLALVAAKALYFLLLYFLSVDAPLPLVLGAGPIGEGPENVMFVFASLAAISILLLGFKSNGWVRGFVFCTVVALISNITLSQKRSAQLGLVVGLIILVWKLPFIQKLKWGALTALVVVAVLLFSAAFGIMPGRGVEASASRFGEISEFLESPEQLLLTAGTLSFHLLDLLDAWDMIKERPLLAYGFGSKYERRYTLLPGVGGEGLGFEAGVVHNQYLHLWWKMGLPGLIAFFWLVGRFLRMGYRAIPKIPTSIEAAIARGFCAALWGDLAMEIWGPQWFASTKVSFVIFLSLALVVRFTQTAEGTPRARIQAPIRG